MSIIEFDSHHHNEWVIDCCLMPSQHFFSAISWQERVRFWIFIALVHWNYSSRVEMMLHLDTLPWFQANKFLHLLLTDTNAACLAEKQQIPINTNFTVFDSPKQGSNPWSTTLDVVQMPMIVTTNHYIYNLTDDRTSPYYLTSSILLLNKSNIAP